MEQKIVFVLQILSIVVPFVLGGIYLVLQTIKYVKQRKSIHLDKLKNADMEFIDWLSQKCIDYIEIAEDKYKTFKRMGSSNTSEMKLNDVLSQIKIDCLNQGVAFDAEFWTARINKFIDLTKKVNSKDGNIV